MIVVNVEQKKRYFSFVLLSIILILLYITKSQYIVFIYLFTVYLYTMRNTNVGFVGWIMGYAFYFSFEDALGIRPHFPLLSIIGFIVIVTIIKSTLSHKKNRFIAIPLIFATIFISLSLISTLFSRNIHISIVPFFLVICANIIFLIVIRELKYEKGLLEDLELAFVFAALSAIISALITGGIIGIDRFRLDENSRKMANTLSPALIVLFYELIRKSKEVNYIPIFPKRVLHILFLAIFLSLVATVSRGAYVGIGVSFLGVLLFYFKMNRLRINFKVLVGLFSMFSISIFSIAFYNSRINIGTLNRVSLDNWLNNPRWLIWWGPLRQLDRLEYFFGSGLGTYRQLEVLTNHNYYAHSVFFDTWVTVGTLALITLCVFLLYTLRCCVKTKNLLGFGLLVFTVWSYMTHGTITGSFEFWTLISISFGSCYCKDDRLAF